MKSLKTVVYKKLKNMIIDGTLACNQRIEEKELASLLQMSRTPVREAIHTLASEGWIHIIPRKGIFVSNISVKSIQDIFQVRKTLEPLILEETFHTIDHGILKSLHQNFRKLLKSSLTPAEREELDQLDHALHLEILTKYNNAFITKMMQNVYEHSIRLRSQSHQKMDRYIQATQEHIAIIEAILESDLPKAIQILQEHNHNSRMTFFQSGTFI